MSIDPTPSRVSGFRPWMVAAPVAVIALAGLGVMALRGAAPETAFGPSGRMQVEVVAPVEPELQPGGTMDVGELTSGYTHVAINQPTTEADAYEADYQSGWVEPSPPLPSPPAEVWSSRDATVRPTQPQPEREGAYGFDRSGPDYAAERRARQERLDRIQRGQPAPGTPPAAPGMDRDNAFY